MSDQNTIYVAKLVPEAILPTRKFPSDAGMDVYASEDAVVLPNNFTIVHTGVTLDIPAGYCVIAKPKSRNDHLVGAGVIDASYQGEILIKVVNFFAHRQLEIKAGDAIAQLLIVPVVTPAIKEKNSDEIHQVQSERGGTGGIVSQTSKKMV